MAVMRDVHGDPRDEEERVQWLLRLSWSGIEGEWSVVKVKEGLYW